LLTKLSAKWPFWVDTHPCPPFKPNADHTETTDRIGETYTFYPEVPAMLHTLFSSTSSPKTSSISHPVQLGVASRTETPDRARDLLKQLYIYPPTADDLAIDSGTPGGSSTSSGNNNSSNNPSTSNNNSKKGYKRAYDMFGNRLEIYPGSKTKHLKELQKTARVEFEDILFFDDEPRNANVRTLGVTFWHVPQGMSWKDLEKGVWEWRKQRVSNGRMPAAELNRRAREQGGIETW
jgi:magnesium-dependent phosphatase 1